ncbi:DivIVA domain-containing protein [Pisciglobus halotolerans]|uniref:Cell division initiation protein n=1 Tax=Pisciglobus halotolerans TaxID=745365 RepID=A0A1I3BW25_9LACT|nr:DivIVA domain-containing protein [Pisciglobus halotolerans]SFH66497.1 cell division initiation protein [Pisciglobus halotolerans]
MVLTPLDIHNKEFPVKMRGYDQDEVNDYLEQIIRDYETLLKEKREIEKELKFAGEKVEHFNNMQEALNKSIIVAQEAADRLKENANKEAEIIHLEAENNADRLLNEAVAKARKITSETEELRKQSRIFKQRLQLMIESQLEMVKNEEWEELLKPELDDTLDLSTVKEVIQQIEQKEEMTAGSISENEAEDVSEIEVGLATEIDLEEDASDGDQMMHEEGSTPAIELPN